MQVVFSSSMALIIMYGNFLLWVVGVRTGVGWIFECFRAHCLRNSHCVFVLLILFNYLRRKREGKEFSQGSLHGKQTREEHLGSQPADLFGTRRKAVSSTVGLCMPSCSTLSWYYFVLRSTSKFLM